MYENADYKSNIANDLGRFIKVYEDVLTPDECNFLIQTFEDSDNKYAGAVFTENGLEMHPESKHVTQAKVEYDSEADLLLSANVGKVLQEYAGNYEYYPAPTAFTDSGYHIKKYEPHTDFYNWHTDNCSLETSLRVIAMLFYLNDVEEGGQTEFDDLNIAVQPKQGRVLLFPTGFTYPHRAVTPVSGPKYIMNTFIGYDGSRL